MNKTKKRLIYVTTLFTFVSCILSACIPLPSEYEMGTIENNYETQYES